MPFAHARTRVARERQKTYRKNCTIDTGRSMLWRRTRPDRNPRSYFTVLCKKYTEIYGGSMRIECLPEQLFSYCRVEFTWISSKFQGCSRAYYYARANNCRRPKDHFACVEKPEAIMYEPTLFFLPSPPTLSIFLAYLCGFDRTPNVHG